MSESVQTVKVPKGVEKYKEIDLKLLPGENVEFIVSMSPLSKMRSYVVCGLVAVFAFLLYQLFSGPITAESLAPPVAAFIALWIVWKAGDVKDVKGLVLSAVKYAAYLVLLSYALAFFASYFAPLLSAVQSAAGVQAEAPKFSADPLENARGILSYAAGLLNAYAVQFAPHIRLASIAAAAVALACIPLVYMSCRGQLYYVTDRRLVIRRKFGTVQVTTLPLDGVVEVTAFQGFFARLLGYGDIVLSMISGGGVTESLQPGPVQPVGGFYSVKRRLEGVRDVWQLKDAIIELRDRYVEARYLARIEDELKRIRQATEQKQAEAKEVKAAEKKEKPPPYAA